MEIKVEDLRAVDIPKHCAICINTFKDKRELEKHKSDVHRTGNVKCDYCDKKFKHKEYLASHVKKLHLTIQLNIKCKICENVFSNEPNLKNHIALIHSMKALSCDFCEEKFVSKNKLEVHLGRKHFKTRTSQCKTCPKKFFSNSDLNAHIVQVHSDLKPFKCDICPAQFKRNSGWHTHRKSHFREKEFQCPVCQKKFKHKASIVNCMNKHDCPDLSYPCTIKGCDAVLKTSDTFVKHKNIHKEDRTRYLCRICTKTLSGKSELKRHIKQVHGNEEKKYQCNICPIKCHSKGQLSTHISTHSGDIFNCPFENCTSKSNTQYGINHHFKKKHGKVKHRKPVEEIKKEKDIKLECSFCDKKIRAGNSPIHSMKVHMKTHEMERPSLECPIQDCEKRILIWNSKNGKSYQSYQLPIQYFNHLETTHTISFEQHEIQVTYQCHSCSNEVVLKTNKARHKMLASAYSHSWGETLQKHIKENHNKNIEIGIWSEEWSNFYERTKIVLQERPVQEMTFIEMLIQSKKCEMKCDFKVIDKFQSLRKAKLLKHYCINHFRDQLLYLESNYFKGDKVSVCSQCGFEVKRNAYTVAKIVHIGVKHNEVIPILKTHF